ncbi:hypothetical protein [Streptomyces sp. NPDC056401]|uniref:hypothetical protein n=1 Tax=Streptomyces sp. NPDC056401 TaxID=3345809 RepID=UPI0035D57A24
MTQTLGAPDAALRAVVAEMEQALEGFREYPEAGDGPCLLFAERFRPPGSDTARRWISVLTPHHEHSVMTFAFEAARYIAAAVNDETCLEPFAEELRELGPFGAWVPIEALEDRALSLEQAAHDVFQIIVDNGWRTFEEETDSMLRLGKMELGLRMTDCVDLDFEDPREPGA